MHHSIVFFEKIVYHHLTHTFTPITFHCTFDISNFGHLFKSSFLRVLSCFPFSNLSHTSIGLLLPLLYHYFSNVLFYIRIYKGRNSRNIFSRQLFCFRTLAFVQSYENFNVFQWFFTALSTLEILVTML